MFRCSAKERPKWELILKTKLSSICTERIGVSYSALKLLKLKDEKHPHLGMLQNLEIKHQCFIGIEEMEESKSEINLFEAEEETKHCISLDGDVSRAC